MNNREMRKEQLRRQIVEVTEVDAEDEDESSPRTVRPAYVRFGIPALAVLIVLAVILVLVRVRNNKHYDTYEVEREVATASGSYLTYEAFADGILGYSSDGIFYMNGQGEQIWNQAYTMKDPHIVISGNFGAVADILSTTIYIFDTTGCRGTINTAKKITDLTISSQGVVAAVLDDDTADYITFFDSTGKKLDIEVKTLLSGDGYPVDIALSPRGTQLVSSYVYLEQGSMRNQVIFRNFDVGQDIPSRLVGGFSQYGSMVVPQVEFLTEKRALAVAEDRLSFYSLQDELSPSLVREVMIESLYPDGSIESVFTGDGKLGVVISTAAVPEGRVFLLFDGSGTELFRRSLSFMPAKGQITECGTALYSSEVCALISHKGVVRYQDEIEGGIVHLVWHDEREIWLISNQSLKVLRLK